MERNVEQHHAFHPGMESWTQYTSECVNGLQNFDAARFKNLIDQFAPQLVTHLADEIPTLLALDNYDIAGVKNAWHKFEKHVQKEADVVSLIQEPLPV